MQHHCVDSLKKSVNLCEIRDVRNSESLAVRVILRLFRESAALKPTIPFVPGIGFLMHMPPLATLRDISASSGEGFVYLVFGKVDAHYLMRKPHPASLKSRPTNNYPSC